MSLAIQIYDNLINVKKDEFEILYTDLYPENGISGIYKIGEGRTLRGAIIGTYILSHYPEKILTTATGESHTFGKDIVDNFNNLEKICKKLNLLIGSASGESEIPLNNLKELIDKQTNKDITINFITTNPNSEIGYIVKSYPKGNIIYLKGRDSEDSKDMDYTEEGIFADKYELEFTRMLNIISKGIVEEIEPNGSYNFYKDELESLKETESKIKELKKKEEYKEYIEDLRSLKKNFHSCGEGVSNDVAKMSNIRKNHVRRYIARRVLEEIGVELQPYMVGAWQNYVVTESDVPNMNENSIFIGISRRGDSPKVKKWSREARKVDAKTYLLTGRDNPEIDSQNLFVLDTDEYYFYSDASIYLSETLTDVMKKFIEEGYHVDKKTLESVHIRDKIYDF